MLKHFSRRTLLLIVGLIAITGLLIYLAVQPPQLNKTTQITPTKAPVAFTTLSLQPISSSSAKQINVTIDTHQNTVTGVQLEIAYDPTVLTNVAIIPGDFFPQSFELIKNIDTTNGRISYALAIPPTGKAKMGQGTIAIISYSILPNPLAGSTGSPQAGSGSTTTLSFLPKTQVSQLGTIESVLKSTSSYTLQLSKPTSTVPTGSQSAH